MNTPTSRYGDASPGTTPNDLVYEELQRVGFTVVREVLSSSQLEYCRRAIDEQLQEQATTFTQDHLEAIGELDIVRAPLVNDEFFLRSIATAPQVLDVARRVIGSYYLLHLQNAIANGPDRPHHQSAWHRDLPYVDRTSSKPFAVSALFCVDEFNASTGATWCIPGSHLFATLPSDSYLDKHAIAIEANAGDVIVFDSMIAHKAGTNTATKPRRAVNNVYSVGIIRQQIDLPRALGGRYADDPELAVLLGYASNAPDSADAYSRRRLDRRGSR